MQTKLTTERQKEIENLTAAILEGTSFIAVLNDRISKAEEPGSVNKMIDMPTEALEKFAQKLFTPKTKAWMRVTKLIESAQKDPDISVNPDAMEFLSMMKTLSGDAWGHWEISRVLQPLIDQVKSEQAKRNAQSKNEAPRAWVLTEWENRTDKGQSKASFARQYAALAKIKFRDTDKGKDLKVTPVTIARDWLPKAKK